MKLSNRMSFLNSVSIIKRGVLKAPLFIMVFQKNLLPFYKFSYGVSLDKIRNNNLLQTLKLVK